MNNEAVIVGDLHGKRHILEKVIKLDKFIISMGDILDAFDNEPKDQIATLEMMIEVVEAEKGILLYGNHEKSYLRDDLRCSGYNFLTSSLLLPLQTRLNRAAEYYVWMPEIKTLITHAGLDKLWWDNLGMTVETLPEHLDNGVRKNPSWFWSIGRSRGGWSEKGGPLWLDWDQEFEFIPDIKQIVGHTRLRPSLAGALSVKERLNESNIRKNVNGDLCIDCLDIAPEVLLLDLDTGEREVLTLD